MIYKKAGVLLALFGVLVSAPAFAFTSPGIATGHVNDFAGILSDDVKLRLETQLSNFEQTDSTEIVVVTLESLDEDTIDNYAVELFENWGIGKKGKDNGVLLLVAPNEREVRIEVGYGLEGDMTDLVSGMIIRKDIIPEFKESDYSAGIENGVNSIIEVSRGAYVMEGKTITSSIFEGLAQYLFLAFFFVVWAGSAIMRKLGSSEAIWPGGAIGGVFGLVTGLIFTSAIIALVIAFGVIGLLFDWFLSRSKTGQAFTSWLIKSNKNGSGGGFFGGFGGGSGGFGGFGGGGSGGGGSSGSW